MWEALSPWFVGLCVLLLFILTNLNTLLYRDREHLRRECDMMYRDLVSMPQIVMEEVDKASMGLMGRLSNHQKALVELWHSTDDTGAVEQVLSRWCPEVLDLLPQRDNDA